MATVMDIAEFTCETDVCSICMEQYKDPRCLTCFHTFCVECLRTFVSTATSEGKFQCPLCRSEVMLPEGGVSAFPVNVYADAKIKKQSHAKEERCGVCEQRAINLCRECGVLFCEPCTKPHRYLPISRSHLLISLDDSSEGKRLFSRERFCEKHKNEKMEFFCKPCTKVICRNCKITNHDGHKTVDISDVVEEARLRLSEAKDELEKCLPQTNSSYDALETKHKHITHVLNKAKTKINTSADKLIEMVNESRNKAIDKVTVLEKSNKGKSNDASSEYKQKQSFLRSQIDHIDDVLKNGLDCDVMTAATEMTERMGVIKKEVTLTTDEFTDTMRRSSIRNRRTSELQSLQCAINNIIRCPLQGLPKDPIIKVINSYDTRIRKIGSITLTESSKAWIVIEKNIYNYFSYIFIKTLVLYCIKTTVLESMCELHVNFSHIEDRGITQVLKEYISKNKNANIPKEECKNLKKEYPHKDVNNNGDRCWVDSQKNRVGIELSDGLFVHLTYSPFAASNQPFSPCDVCWGKKDEVYIVDQGSKSIVLYSVTEGFLKALFIPNLDPCFDPSAVVMDGEGHLWIGEVNGRLSICEVE